MPGRLTHVAPGLCWVSCTRATPLGSGLGSHPPTLNLPRRTAADHHLPKVRLNDGLSDDLHTARTVTRFLEAGVYLSVILNAY